jgi:hypothetical protein
MPDQLSADDEQRVESPGRAGEGRIPRQRRGEPERARRGVSTRQSGLRLLLRPSRATRATGPSSYRSGTRPLSRLSQRPGRQPHCGASGRKQRSYRRSGPRIRLILDRQRQNPDSGAGAHSLALGSGGRGLECRDVAPYDGPARNGLRYDTARASAACQATPWRRPHRTWRASKTIDSCRSPW